MIDTIYTTSVERASELLSVRGALPARERYRDMPIIMLVILYSVWTICGETCAGVEVVAFVVYVLRFAFFVSCAIYNICIYKNTHIYIYTTKQHM